MSRLCVISAIATVASLFTVGKAQGQPDPLQSFYVPEAVVAATVVYPTSAGGDIANPGNALFYFKTCPNNHGGGAFPVLGFLTNNARVHVVLRDAAGLPIVGFPAGMICVQLNGGTAAQSFGGPGADSLIANSTLPSTNGLGGFPLCPDVRCIAADGPTDAFGSTFITLTGAGGVRDPGRKWGHFDSFMPVLVGGVPIAGKSNPGAALGSYILSVRNVDHAGGTSAIPVDIAEAVGAPDYNSWIAQVGYRFQDDFDGDGFKSAADLNTIIAHLTHDCDTPANP